MPNLSREEHEAPLRALVEDRITSVHYFEIAYPDGHTHWFDDPRFDSLDFALQLHLASGRSLVVTWGNEWECYGLSFNAGLLPYPVCNTAEVTHHSRWRDVLGAGLAEVAFDWSWFGEPDGTRSYYPQTARLTFSSGAAVYLSAFEYRNGQLAVGAAGHITVAFSHEMARELRIWPA